MSRDTEFLKAFQALKRVCSNNNSPMLKTRINEFLDACQNHPDLLNEKCKNLLNYLTEKKAFITTISPEITESCFNELMTGLQSEKNRNAFK